MKKKFLQVFSLMAVMAISATATAQVDFSPIFTQIKLEARADFDYFHNTSTNYLGSTRGTDSPYGIHGQYFNFVVGGPINDKFSYFFRQRIIAKPGTVSLFDNTDFLYVNYMPSKNWMFRMGKDALAVGGFEYDAPPINVLFSTVYWNNFYCFQPAMGVAYKSDDATQMLLLQVANSPYIYYGADLGYGLGSEWKSGLLAYSIYWSGNFGHFKVLHSANMFQRPDRGFMNYVALGHKLVYDHWDIYLDLIHHSFAHNDLFKNYAVVSCANVYFNSGINLFVKGAYEQNKSNEVIPTFGQNGLFDCLMPEPGKSYCTYGIGMEYHPNSCKDFRLHAFVANQKTVADETLSHDIASMLKTKETNSLQFNVGITWDMDIHRMLKDRAAKVAAQPAIDTYYK